MDKTYSPAEIEQRWYARWEASGDFAPRPDPGAQPFCIMIPPPNVTGTLHMGHAFQDTIMDALTRFHRMRGDAALWQPGTDHAGIATQMLVERQLNAEGVKRTDLSREAVHRTRVGSGRASRAAASPSKCGASVPRSTGRAIASRWTPSLRGRSRKYSSGSMSRNSSTAASDWSTGIRYCAPRCPTWKCFSEEESGPLWYLRYPLADGQGAVGCGDHASETMIGDTAVAVHPEDERYPHLSGKSLRLPMTGREIPIIADEYVDPAFGTGCVKITPAHDFNDYAGRPAPWLADDQHASRPTRA